MQAYDGEATTRTICGETAVSAFWRCARQHGISGRLLADRFGAVRNRAQTPYLTIWFGDGYGDRFSMDIQTQKTYLFLHDRLPSACGSELCVLPNHSLTHDERIGAGHSILTVITYKEVLRVAYDLTANLKASGSWVQWRLGNNRRFPSSISHRL